MKSTEGRRALIGTHKHRRKQSIFMEDRPLRDQHRPPHLSNPSRTHQWQQSGNVEQQDQPSLMRITTAYRHLTAFRSVSRQCNANYGPWRGVIWIVDAHRDYGKRFVVCADEQLTAFVERESVIRFGRTQMSGEQVKLDVDKLPLCS